MATISVEIPDGEFCSDKGHLDCLYAQHSINEHYCHLFRSFLNSPETVKVDGETRRLRRKCKACLNALNGHVGPLAIKVDTEDNIKDENRKEHFDIYLKEALENSKITESVYSVAKLAARLKLEEEQKELKGYELEEFELHYDSKLENYTYEYEHELRSANIE